MDIEKSYTILGLSPDATLDEIKHAYRAKVKEYHPDLAAVNPSLQKRFEEKMKEINIAYHFLLSSIQHKERLSPRKPETSADAKNFRPKTDFKKTSQEPFAQGKAHSFADKRRGRSESNRSPQSLRPEKNIISILIERIISRLTPISTKKEATVLGPKKPVKRKHPIFMEPQREFNDILNDILKAQANHEENARNRRKLREKYDYFSMKSHQSRSNKADPKGPVGSISPVSRVKKIYRDH